MLFGFGSLLLVFLITTYVVIVFFRRKESIKKSTVELIAMVLNFVASTFVGLLATQIFGKTFSTLLIIALLVAVCLGYVIGKSFEKLILMNIVLTGILGAMIGTTLGILTFTAIKGLLIIDILFIVLMFFVLKWLDSKIIEIDNIKKKNKNNVQPNANKDYFIDHFLNSVKSRDRFKHFIGKKSNCCGSDWSTPIATCNI